MSEKSDEMSKKSENMSEKSDKMSEKSDKMPMVSDSNKTENAPKNELGIKFEDNRVEKIKTEPAESTEESPANLSFMSETSGTGSVSNFSSVSGYVGNPDGEVSAVFHCPFCSKKHLTKEYTEKHIVKHHSISLAKVAILGLEIKMTEL